MSANFFKMAFVKEIIKEVENLYLSTSLLLHFSKCWKSQTQLEKKNHEESMEKRVCCFCGFDFCVFNPESSTVSMAAPELPLVTPPSGHSPFTRPASTTNTSGPLPWQILLPGIP